MNKLLSIRIYQQHGNIFEKQPEYIELTIGNDILQPINIDIESLNDNEDFRENINQAYGFYIFDDEPEIIEFMFEDYKAVRFEAVIDKGNSRPVTIDLIKLLKLGKVNKEQSTNTTAKTNVDTSMLDISQILDLYTDEVVGTNKNKIIDTFDNVTITFEKVPANSKELYLYIKEK